MNRHLVLVGLPGAGKSAVGRLVARMMGVESHDIDEAIARNEGAAVAEIITDRGEREFRRLEKHETERALARPAAVVVPGGGWAAAANNLNDVRGRAFTVYLETTAQTAAARVGVSGDRPLLDGPDFSSRMTDLLTIRRPFYERCDATVSTDEKTVQQVARNVVELARGATAG